MEILHAITGFGIFFSVPVLIGILFCEYGPMSQIRKRWLRIVLIFLAIFFVGKCILLFL